MTCKHYLKPWKSSIATSTSTTRKSSMTTKRNPTRQRIDEAVAPELALTVKHPEKRLGLGSTYSTLPLANCKVLV